MTFDFVMKILITPTNKELSLVVFDTEKGEITRTVERDERADNKNADESRAIHRPFGISWNKDNLFVANRKNLLVYGKDWKLEHFMEDVLDENTHQITWWRNKIIITMSRLDCVQIMGENGEDKEYYRPFVGWSKEQFSWAGTYVTSRPDKPKDLFHINSVVVVDDILYIMMSNSKHANSSITRKSQILALNLKTREVEKLYTPDAKNAHGLYVNGKEFGILDTRRHRVLLGDDVISKTSWDKKVWLRGITGDEKDIVVGVSYSKKDREERGKGDANLVSITNRKISNQYTVKDIGAINDIKRIDGVDFSHHNPFEFPLPLKQ